MGIPELVDDDRYSTFEARVANREAMREELVRAFASRSAVEWETLLGEQDVPASAVLSFPQALAQPQLQHRDFLIRPRAPKGFDEPLTFFNAAYEAPEDSLGTDLPPPGVGEHSQQVLAEFGFTADEISSLRKNKAIDS